MSSFCHSPGRHFVSSTPEDETLATLHYDMVEQVIDAAETVIQMHPDNNAEQISKMLYLFVGAMSAFIQSVPGIQIEHVLTLAKKAHETAHALSKNESLN